MWMIQEEKKGRIETLKKFCKLFEANMSVFGDLFLKKIGHDPFGRSFIYLCKNPQIGKTKENFL